MEQQKLPQFAVIALDALNAKKQREDDKKRADEQKNFDHLFESLQVVLGEDAAEIITSGEIVPRLGDRDAYLRFQNFGFKSTRGGWCGDADRFNFTVLENHNGVWKADRYHTWHTVKEHTEIGQIIADAAKKESIAVARVDRETAAMAEPRKYESKMFDQVAERFQKNNPLYLDVLLYQIKYFFDHQFDLGNQEPEEDSEDE